MTFKKVIHNYMWCKAIVAVIIMLGYNSLCIRSKVGNLKYAKYGSYVTPITFANLHGYTEY